jgi:hypothetical protein
MAREVVDPLWREGRRVGGGGERHTERALLGTSHKGRILLYHWWDVSRVNPLPLPTPGGDLIPFSILLNGEGRAELPGGVEGDACVGHLASRVRG